MFDFYKSGYGLVTVADPISENCNLFYACDLTLQLPLDDFEHSFALTFFSNNMKMKMNPKMLVYNRRPDPDDRSMSLDEIYGMMITSKILGTEHKNEIWKHLIWHFGSYNNTGRLLDYLPFNPGNYYSWAQYGGSLLFILFFPIYFINLILCCRQPSTSTSSKIIYWLDLMNLPNNFLNKFLKSYFEKRMIAQYGVDYISALMKIYHGRESDEFPIFKHLLNRKK